ncbi:unnamed protein product, partial [marine sediment metagenome]
RKFDIPFNSIYLLEIRNAEWTAPQVRTFAEFIRWLVNWTKDLLGERTIEFLFRRGFNILSNPLSTVGRGLGCSVQSTLFIRLGDLSLMPCHRTSYPQFIYGNLETDGEKVTGLNIRNPELMMGIYSLVGDNLPFCENCLIKPLCQKGCLGAQYETTGDLFTPIPTVCMLEHGKIIGLARGLIETGLFNEVLNRVKEEKRFALEQIAEMGGKKYEF